MRAVTVSGACVVTIFNSCTHFYFPRVSRVSWICFCCGSSGLQPAYNGYQYVWSRKWRPN